MIDVKKKEVQNIMRGMHNALEARIKRDGKVREKFLLENRMLQVLCEESEMEPRVCAEKLNAVYGYFVKGDDVIKLLRERILSNRKEREELFSWARQVADSFAEAVNGSIKAYREFEQLRRGAALLNGKRHSDQERVAMHMIYVRYPELVIDNDAQQICLLGHTFAKYLFLDMADLPAEEYGYPQNGEKIDKSSKDKMTYEQAIRKIAMLENSLERTNIMLRDLQEEFEEQLEESRVKELTEFFAKLNSEKYGCILDELLQVRKGAEVLRKNAYVLPIEINGMLIMVKKLIQFVKDSHIEPIMKIDSIRQVLANEIEFCNYEGTPFASKEEVKTIKVISPGWIYKDKEIQISRPKVKEEM